MFDNEMSLSAGHFQLNTLCSVSHVSYLVLVWVVLEVELKIAHQELVLDPG